MGIAAHKIGPAYLQAGYDYKRRWDSTAQPELLTSGKPLPVEDYIAIAQDAAPDMMDQIGTFMEANGMTYNVIPHGAFRSEYEKGPRALDFRTWYEDYCEKAGMNPQVDMCIIGPRVKTDESASRKTGTNDTLPDRNRDYLAFMGVVLKKRSNLKNKFSLDTMGAAVERLENYEGVLAHKNYLYRPHEHTGIRYHATLWMATAPAGKMMEGMRVLGEFKLEHESQMDLDKLTRSFIDMERSSVRSLFSMCSLPGTKAWTSQRSINERTDTVVQWGRMLYDRIFEDAGFGRFLAPDARAQHAAEKWNHILDHMISTSKAIDAPSVKNMMQAICESAVLQQVLVPNDVRRRACALAHHIS